jgi:hypothetical protein
VATAWRLLSTHTPGVVEMGNSERSHDPKP